MKAKADVAGESQESKMLISRYRCHDVGRELMLTKAIEKKKVERYMGFARFICCGRHSLASMLVMNSSYLGDCQS